MKQCCALYVFLYSYEWKLIFKVIGIPGPISVPVDGEDTGYKRLRQEGNNAEFYNFAVTSLKLFDKTSEIIIHGTKVLSL